jgi:hypothetical protein
MNFHGGNMAVEAIKPVTKATTKKTKNGLYVTISPEHRAELEKLAKDDMRPGASEMLSVLVARNFAKLTGKAE